MARTSFDSTNNPDLFKAILSKQQSDEIGEVVDHSIELASKLREERAQRDRLEHEAEERAERLWYFKELEAEDAKRLREREAIAERERQQDEAQRDRAERAQIIADLRRADQLWA